MSRGMTVPKGGVSKSPSVERPCIHEMFEAQAARTPYAVAVSCGEERLTYRQLNEQANQLARYLRKLGVGAETPVALYLERSVRMVTAILGVLKAGGAYVPIDLAYPKERLSFMLEDAQAPVLLTQQSLRAAVTQRDGASSPVVQLAAGASQARPPKVVCVDTDWPEISAGAGTHLQPSPDQTAESAAYIIYTSGSTGKPKGVVVTHHNVVRLLRKTEHWYGFNPTDVWPLFHSYAFDVSVWELWGALFYGGRLVVVPYLVTRSPGEFYELLAKEKVTVLNQTPSAFRQLIWAEETAERKHELSLRFVICAGEALELQSLKPWFARHGDQTPKIVNKYGITETTVHSTYRVIRQEDLTSGVGSVIGVPIPDLQIYLVDEGLRPVPNGEPGEICVGGEGVARGYLKRPDLTRQRFLPDPFSAVPGARMYRSGDLAQVNAHGELEYLGRIDHQVKIRGFRVELGEIESALNQHPAIRENVVIAQDDSKGGKRLVAYLVAKAGKNSTVADNVAEPSSPPTITELREYLGMSLPDYMVPAIFMFLDVFPLTTNGKIDRRALPSPGGERPQLKAEFVAPQTPTQAKLAAIWSDVLGVATVGVNDNFFELGGDSIRSIIILARAQQCGWRLSLEQIFSDPTVAGLASCAEAESRQPEVAPTQPFALISAEDRAKLPADVEDAYPLTRLQMGMFFYNELNPLSAMYHDVFSYRVQGQFDREKLREAVNLLAARHPLLRTSFHLARFSEALQLVHRGVQVPFTVEDLRALGAAEQDRRLVDWIEAEKRRPFDRSIAPMFRFHAQVRGENSFQFVISFHHSCLDGWSLAAVVTELLQDYAALRQSAPQNLAPPRITYRDFVALEQQSLASAESRKFWAEKLNQATPQTLPRWPKGLREGGHEQRRGPECQIDPGVFAGLKALAQAEGVPLKTVLLAAHQRVMNLLYGQPDVVSGLVCNGRPEALDGEKLVGLFLNTLPLRQRIEGGTWSELVKQTFATERELVGHRRFPLAEIQKMMAAQPDGPRGQPLFETAFDYVHFHVLNQLQSCREFSADEGAYFEANNLTTYTTFILDATSTKLELHIDYDPNALCRKQVEQMSIYYVNTLRAMASNPQGRYETFSPLSPEETRELLVDWNETQEEYPRMRRITELFDERVQETPQAIALVCGEETLTYAQLYQRAEVLAQQLRALDLDPEELVGLCVERAPEMLIALLAILKAGAAYLPLDPTYPKERLAFMVQDARVCVLLTQPHLVDSLPKTAARVLCIGKGAPAQNLAASDDPETVAHSAFRTPRPSDLAYVIYTSGSTGKPKGVQVTQRALVNLLISAARTIGFTTKDNLLAVTTLSFDIAGLELFLPLISGGRLTLASREQASDGTQLSNLIKTSGATVMQGTPATWRLLLEAGWRGNKFLKVLCGGEALKRNLADDLLKRAKEVWNFYGPTETTVWSTAWKVKPEEPISIGRPLANTQLYILNRHLTPVPVGTAGELHIGGDGLARGYLYRPELTAERFVPNPFALHAGSRLYKTGDLARYLPDGRVECLGRLDQQVKIRGFRIEIGEVEMVLRQHASVADALVTTRDDALGERRLVGYIISKNGPLGVPELRDFMKTKLPPYMVPAHFVCLDQFPLTPNGKVDLRLLPAPDRIADTTRNYVAPRNAEEETLAAIWREVLMVNRVGIEDDFFELGGESLSATRAFARINRAFATDLTLREILDRPTIRSLAELVAKNKGSGRSRAPIIPRRGKPSSADETLTVIRPHW